MTFFTNDMQFQDFFRMVTKRCHVENISEIDTKQMFREYPFQTIFSIKGFSKEEISCCFFYMPVNQFIHILKNGDFDSHIFIRLTRRADLFGEYYKQYPLKINAFINLLTEKILLKMHHLEELDISDNVNITSLYSNKYTLRVLYANGNSVILNDELKTLKSLEVLHLKNNRRITILPKNLTELDISMTTTRYNSGITEYVLSTLKGLKKLNISGNKNIKNIQYFSSTLKYLRMSCYKSLLENFTGKLQYLDISNSDVTTIENLNLSELEYLNISGTNISSNAIRGAVHLKTLKAFNNDYIDTLSPFAETLEELDISKKFPMSHSKVFHHEEISKLVNLKILNISCIINSCNINHLPITHLYANMSGIQQKDISGLSQLKTLHISGCAGVYDLRSFGSTLEELDISRSFYPDLIHCLTDRGLAHLTCLKILRANNNNFVHNINSFAKTLIELEASQSCAISDDSLCNAGNLEVLCASDNDRITTVKPFAKSLVILDASQRCGINDRGLSGITNVFDINLEYNSRISNLYDAAKHIIRLNISGNSSIRNSYMGAFICLQELYMNYRGDIFDLTKCIKNLFVLSIRYIVPENEKRYSRSVGRISYSYYMSNILMINAVNLQVLYIDYPLFIEDIRIFSRSLVKLHINNKTDICWIDEMINLRYIE